MPLTETCIRWFGDLRSDDVAVVGENASPPGKAGLRFVPRTRAGWFAVANFAAFVACLAALYSLIAAGQRGGDRFFDNLWLALPALVAGASGLLAGISAALSIALWRERSIAVMFVLIVGLLVTAFLLAEFVGEH